MNIIIKCGASLIKRSVSNSAILNTSNRTLFAASLRPIGASFSDKTSSYTHLDSHICKCWIREVHSKEDVSGGKELMDFLNQEILTERKLQKSKHIPSQLDEFQVNLNGSDVVLTKSSNDEIIEIKFNINHSVSSPGDLDMDPAMNKDDYIEMKSRPNFDINIKRGDTTLTFSCVFLTEQPDQEAQQTDGEEGSYGNDLFVIEEMTIYKGEWNEKNYAVSGDVLDGYLYDLLMNFLEEKGISNEFADKISQLSTSYEHSTYINFLGDLKKFIS